ncbi:SUF system NifU family Fe-S cluster assembly protein [Colwellia psychrerythraea]|uniref:SUF system NifU family Fe-S cluster assembly protein n=1 Tax=Colwellia psychrerythraea TaxID=28229 RepID=A0A1Y5E091_COLPS|nr:SUF system NifU family Fe-S cluster assembly protein [Colwellia psychrerythraea]
MNEELRALYQEVIIDHGRHPRNFKKLEEPSCCQEGYNPLCGDRLTLYLKVDHNKIIDASFEGVGCAISMASTSLMIERIKNIPIIEAQQLFEAFHLLVTEPSPTVKTLEYLGKLTVLGGVRDFPTRIKCATLGWHALKAGLDNAASEQRVSTE